MKGRESGMPDEEYWGSFFNPRCILEKLDCAVMPGDAVEFGCGYGTFTIATAGLITGRVFALDIEPTMIAESVRKSAEAGLANVVVEERDVLLHGSGLPDGSAAYAHRGVDATPRRLEGRSGRRRGAAADGEDGGRVVVEGSRQLGTPNSRRWASGASAGERVPGLGSGSLATILLFREYLAIATRTTTSPECSRDDQHRIASTTSTAREPSTEGVPPPRQRPPDYRSTTDEDTASTPPKPRQCPRDCGPSDGTYAQQHPTERWSSSPR